MSKRVVSPVNQPSLKIARLIPPSVFFLILTLLVVIFFSLQLPLIVVIDPYLKKSISPGSKLLKDNSIRLHCIHTLISDKLYKVYPVVLNLLEPHLIESLLQLQPLDHPHTPHHYYKNLVDPQSPH